MKISLSLYGCISTSENASVNHTGEIWAVKLCSVTTLAMRPKRVTVTLRFPLFSAHNRPNWGCVSQALEGRNTAHFLAFDGRSLCSFELHVMKTSMWMMKFRAIFRVRDLAVYIGSHSFQLLTALAAGSLGFSRFGKIGQPHPNTPVSLVFFPILKFWKITNEGRIRKQMCWQLLDPRENNFQQNCPECDPALILLTQ